MKNTIAEYGFVIIAIILCASVFKGIIPLFQDGGAIRDNIIDYITNLC